MSKNSDRQPISPARIALAFLIMAVCVLFIWGNSMLPPSQSSAISQKFSKFLVGLLSPILGPESYIVRFIKVYVRKIAHAAEFFMLGSCSILMLIVLKRLNIHMILHCVLLVLLVAVADESIQMFTNRGHEVRDIVIDFIGGMAGIVFVLVVYFLFSFIRSLFNRKKEVEIEDY